MSIYSDAKNFFEINMIKDFNSKKMLNITEREIKFLQKHISDHNANILDVMCGYGRLGNRLYDFGYKKISGVDMGTFDFISEQKKFKLNDREVLNFRDGDKVYSSEWFEDEEPDYNYYEQVVVRDWETGEEIERFDGRMHRMPNGDIWRM